MNTLTTQETKVATLNDLFRTTGFGGQTVITYGISILPDEVRSEISMEVLAFDKFTEDNDPYGEHDFGSFNHPKAGKIFWKIDYYDPTLSYSSEDPSDPKKTSRILTIMLAEEY